MYEDDRITYTIPQSPQTSRKTFLIAMMHLWMDMKLALMLASSVRLFVRKLNIFTL
jgi:hypothetical protein